MTTTKEDQIRDEFENTIDPDWLRRWEDTGEYREYSIERQWQVHKACAESYEKKLAEKDAEIATHIKNVHHFQNAYVEAQLGISEANARNAMLVEALKDVHTDIDMLISGRFVFLEETRDELCKAISANSAAVAAWEAEKLREDRLYLARCFRENDRGILASAEQIAQMLEGMANDVNKG